MLKNQKTREPIMPVAAKIRQGKNLKLEAAKKPCEMGMMAMAATPCNVIALASSLIVSKDEIDEGIGISNQAQGEQIYRQKLSASIRNYSDI